MAPAATQDETTPGTDETEPDEIKRAAQGGSLSTSESSAALAWLLEDTPDDDEERFKTLTINIGRGTTERWIDWTIRSIDRDVLRAIQRGAQGNRQARRGRGGPGEIDAGEANLRIVANATVEPDLREAARRKGVQMDSPDPMYAPMQVLRHRFQDKPGLIDQIAGEVMDISGYDEEDVQEARAKDAAGN